MYEIYVETYGQNAQNQVNPATFGKVSYEDLVILYTLGKTSKFHLMAEISAEECVLGDSS
jgi:hypothetical protein